MRSIPEGWQLVPIRLPDEIILAGLYQCSADMTFEDLYSAWLDMLSVAPSWHQESETAP